MLYIILLVLIHLAIGVGDLVVLSSHPEWKREYRVEVFLLFLSFGLALVVFLGDRLLSIWPLIGWIFGPIGTFFKPEG